MATLQPVGVKGGELVSAQSYREIAERRGGMSYVPAQMGNTGPEFTPDRDGTFTRNVVNEGGQLWAEIA